MRLLLVIPLLALCGCVGVVRELEKGQLAVVHHTRGAGLDVKIPNQAGDTLVSFRFGWFSDTTTVIPCSSNKVFSAAVSDTHKIDTSVSFSGTGTKITEDLVSGYDGAPPTPRHVDLFSPKP